MARPKLRILLVESDPAPDPDLEQKLRTSPLVISVHRATSTAAGIAYLEGQGDYADRSRHPLPSLVVIDLGVAEGLKVLSRLRERWERPTIPVVVISPTRENLELGRARELGAHSCLIRPLPPGELTAVLEAVHVR